MLVSMAANWVTISTNPEANEAMSVCVASSAGPAVSTAGSVKNCWVAMKLSSSSPSCELNSGKPETVSHLLASELSSAVLGCYVSWGGMSEGVVPGSLGVYRGRKGQGD